MGSIYLIRHGQASFGAADYDVLSASGIRQAEILGDYLLALDIRFDRLISGNLRRQQHTALTVHERYLAAGTASPGVEIDPAFDELDADTILRAYLPDILIHEPQAVEILRDGAKNPKAFQRIFAQIIAHWVNDDQDQPGVQSWPDFQSRVFTAVQTLLQEADRQDRIAIFTSGGTITSILQKIVGMSAVNAFELNWQIVNTSLTRLKFRDPQTLSLSSFNGYPHLEALKIPELITYR